MQSHPTKRLRWRLLATAAAWMPVIAGAAAPEINNFRLLYSTPGYDSRGTKQAVIRTMTGITASDVSVVDSRWDLTDSANGTVAASGPIAYFGNTWGVQYWTADFSAFKGEGRYFLKVTLKQDAATLIGTKQSLTFSVQKNNFSKSLLIPLSLDNADLRKLGGAGAGFCDATSVSFAEAYAHAMFLYGFLEMYKAKYADMGATDKARLIADIDIAFDHILSYWSPDSTTLFRHPEGPPRGGMNDIEPIFAMAMYISMFKGMDAARASDSNFAKVVKGFNLLKATASGWQASGYQEYKDYLIPVAFYLYKYSGDAAWKDTAVTRLNAFLPSFDLRTHYRGPLRGIPFFEGLRLCAEEFPADPNYATWISQARTLKDTYYKSARIWAGNVFRVINTSSAADPAGDWDAGRVTSDTWGSLQIDNSPGPYAKDALILANLTGDGSLEKIAAGEIYWEMGLNPGIPAASILNPASATDREAAAFIVNGPFRHVTRVNYHCPMLGPDQQSPYMTIVNGFNTSGGPNEFAFDGTVSYNGEVFIKHDGDFIVGNLMYEDYLNRQENTGIRKGHEEKGGEARMEASLNPFTMQITFSYFAPRTSDAGTIRIFDLAGKMIEELTAREVGSGKYAAVWNESGIPPGRYVARLTNGAGSPKAQRIVLLIR